jgi:hypothetical protein
MKNLIALVLLSAGLAACGGKKAETTTPKPVEHKGDAAGGAPYGGAAYGAGKTPAKTANPCAGTKPGS